MPQRDVRMCLENMLQAARRIERLADGKSLNEYAGDENLRLISERSFEIIGEALKQAIRVDPSLQQAITNATRIIDFRNFLIHGYDLVDHSIVWDIIRTYLPTLIREVEFELAKREE